MRRYPAFDPPEYVAWKPDKTLVAGFAATLESNPERAAVVAQLDQDALLELYRGLLRRRGLPTAPTSLIRCITRRRWWD